MTDVSTLLRQAELDAEKTAALIRVVMFLSLASAILSTDQAPGGHALAATALYGVGTAVGLLLAWRRVFHPAIPYLFVGFDVVLVATQVFMLAHQMGMGSSAAFAVPTTALIFVILNHAAMRYRPWLVVYAAALFLAAIELGRFLVESSEQKVMGRMSAMGHDSMGSLLNFQILPVVVIALAAFILFVTGRRTRHLLITSIRHVARTARLSRFFSPNLAASIAEGDDDQLLAGRRQPAAVLFVDIRGFTALGESMAPDELGAFLTEYRNRLVEPVFAHGGTVDKFIGDAIMAVFGSPVQRPDDPARALRCALEIIEIAARWSAERERMGQAPVAIGIGAHYGEVFAGALGGEQILEYTVIGDTVNVAERLERLSRDVASTLVVSSVLLEAAGAAGEFAKWRSLPPQQLKGHQRPVEAFCLE